MSFFPRISPGIFPRTFRGLSPRFLRQVLMLFVLWLCVLPFASQAQSGASAHSARRIRFERGAISTQVRGQLNRKQSELFYVVKARAGQHMIVNVVPLGNPYGLVPFVLVTPPKGEGTGDKSSIYEGDLTDSGDYQIRVAVNQMASESSAGGFLLEVVIR
jgi:hypothetical protein